MKLCLKSTRLGLLNSTTRIPFRYGKACLTRCPQAVLEATVEVEGKQYQGYGADCFPPSWFDKSPSKSYATQIDEMLLVIALAEASFTEELATPGLFFPSWLTTYQRVQDQCRQRGLTPLLASFGVSMVERALLDAQCRAAQLSFADALRHNLPAMDPAAVHLELRGSDVAAWLPPEPAKQLFVRHTVGLTDPLTASDIPDEERLDDGFPQALEEYIERNGLRYFKIKVSNQLDHDLERLLRIAAVVEKARQADYLVTLDGNEQYRSAEELGELVDRLRSHPELQTLWQNTLLIEQPLERSVALAANHADGIRQLSCDKPVIIDESDGELGSFSNAIELGYGGVSSKNCKGPIKSVLNAGLLWWHNQQHPTPRLVMTGEDLCTVGVVPLQADLCLVATLGLEHVERNGHHYHPGLSYLDSDQQRAALAAHGDLYQEVGGTVAPVLVNGRFRIASLQCTGFGFNITPNMEAMPDRSDWTFASLGLEQ